MGGSGVRSVVVVGSHWFNPQGPVQETRMAPRVNISSGSTGTRCASPVA